ncbi:hypothetical protein HD554DRAFT_2082193 [Boletus coccyginus]|nr:hypothetical protein HD554DRAFT_2082193 [Boletus coccyginus]
MLTHREFSAWIVSEDKSLPEYLVAIDTNGSKVSCWIPSEAGKNFSVHWRDGGTRVHSCAFISLDGFQVPGRFLSGYGDASREGVRTGSNTERPFVFVGPSSTSSGGQINPDAGTIVLKIRRVAIDGARAPNKLQQLPGPSGSQSNVCVGYGDERHAYEQFPRTWQVKPYDGSGNRSYVTFVFRYRSREFLLSQGIIPADDALQIPLAVRRACAMNRRVASAPVPAGNSMLMTPSPTPSPQITENSERMGSALQNAFNPGSVPIRPATNLRTVSMNATGRRRRYPGEGILDFDMSNDPMM